MIITFLGHRSVFPYEALSNILKAIIVEEVKQSDHTIFYCGGYGDFDNLCARVCRSIADRFPNCEVVYITPYLCGSKPKSGIDHSLYDSILYPPLENVPPRFAIDRRNEWMINQADLIVAFVDHSYGGAYKSLTYAKRKKKRIINLSDTKMIKNSEDQMKSQE